MVTNVEAHLEREAGATPSSSWVVTTGQTITLGQGPGADVILTDPALAPRHLAVMLQGDTLRVVDLGGAGGEAVRILWQLMSMGGRLLWLRTALRWIHWRADACTRRQVELTATWLRLQAWEERVHVQLDALKEQHKVIVAELSARKAARELRVKP